MASKSESIQELQQTVLSTVVSSPKNLSIEQLQKDYEELNGHRIPFKSLGFNSIFELLQSMNNKISIPTNPTEKSVISLIGSSKCNHIADLISKQKNNSKRRKPKAKENRNGFCNNLYSKYYTRTTNYNSSRSRTSRTEIIVHSTNNNHKSQPSSRSNSAYNDKRNNSFSRFSRNDTQKTYDALKVTQIIESKESSLLNNHISDSSNISLNLSGINNSQNSADGHHSINKLFTSVSKTNYYETTNITNGPPSIKEDKFVNECMITSMVRTLNDLPIVDNHSIDKVFTSVLNKNEDESTNNMTNGPTTKEDAFLNKCSTKINASNLNLTCQSKKIELDHAHATSKSNLSDKIENSDESLKDIHNKKYLRDYLGRISIVFRAYDNALDFVLFSFLYLKLFYSVFDTTKYGYNSFVELLKDFDEMFEIQNGVYYKKKNFQSYSQFISKEQMFNELTYLKPQMDIVHSLSLNNRGFISLNIEPKCVTDDSIKCLVSEAYSPALFFIQKWSDVKSLNHQMKQMEIFYNKSNTQFCVNPEQVLVGSCYVAYTECRNTYKWCRVKIILEVDSMSVQVFQVDFGNVVYILKKNLRFLVKDFSKLPCQAIHCCLYNFNKFGKVEENLKDGFFEIVARNGIIFDVKIEKNIILYDKNQVLHVTLFDQLKNINHKLIIDYM